MATKLKNVHANRLLKLADFLDKVKPEKFSIHRYVLLADSFNSQNIPQQLANHDCGTVACAIGYMPMVSPRDWKYSPGGDPMLRRKDMLANVEHPLPGKVWLTSSIHAEWYFGLSSSEWNSLFLGGHHYPNVNPTPTDVSNKIREFVAGKSKAVAV